MKTSPPSRANIAALLLIALLPTSGAYAEGTPQQGAQIWDRLGCWNCHGSNGYTNLSRAGRPSIAKTRLPLRRFVGQIRLPMGNMPPAALPWLAPDADLAVVYRWLGGAEAVESPPPVSIDLETSTSGAEVEIAMTAQRARGVSNADVRDPASLDYRVTLITNSQSANENLEYRRTRDHWSKIALSEDGEAVLGRDRGFTAPRRGDGGNVQARLRMPVPAVRTVVVIEALAEAESAKPVVVGIGSVIVKPAQNARGPAVGPAGGPAH